MKCFTAPALQLQFECEVLQSVGSMLTEKPPHHPTLQPSPRSVCGVGGDPLGTLPGMLNKSEHLSYLNLPASTRCDWLGGWPGMGKRPDSGGRRLIRPAYETGFAVEERTDGEQTETGASGGAVLAPTGDPSMTCEFDFWSLRRAFLATPSALHVSSRVRAAHIKSDAHTQTHTHPTTQSKGASAKITVS